MTEYLPTQWVIVETTNCKESTKVLFGGKHNEQVEAIEVEALATGFGVRGETLVPRTVRDQARSTQLKVSWAVMTVELSQDASVLPVVVQT